MPNSSRSSAPLRRWWARPERWLALVACAFAGLSFASVALLIFGWFHPVTVIPIAILLTALLAWTWGDWAPVPAERADPRWFWALAAVIALASVGVNAAWANEHTTLNRDPGTYFNAALVLRDHGAPTFHPVWGGYAGEPDLDQAGPGLLKVSEGRYGFQGLHLLPALGAAAGWAGGDNVLARVPAILGGLFLLFLMGFARRLVGPVWALVAGASFALLVPFAYGGRDFLSEMVLGPALFAALWLLADALDGRPERRAILPGALLGAGAMARIDSPLALIGFLAFLGLWLTSHRHRWRTGLAVLGPMLLGVALAGADGWINAKSYFIDHESELLGQAALLGALGVVMVAWWVVDRRWSERVAAWWPRYRWRAATASAVLVIALMLFGLFLRPHLQDVHAVARATLIEGYQQVEGLPIDGTSSYDQDSVRWLTWYLGPVAFAAAVAGGAWLLHRTVRGVARRPELLAMSVLAPPLALYLYRPSIYPDHPWATRRFLPVVFPMLLVLACWCAARLWERRAPARAVLRVAAVLLAAGTLIFPAAVLAPIWQFRVFTDRLGQVRQVCDVLPPKAAVIVVADPFEVNTRVLATVCDVPAATATNDDGIPTRQTLDEVAAAWRRHGRELWLVGLRQGVLQGLGVKDPVEFQRTETHALASSLKHRPNKLLTQTISMDVGRY
ncbi:MAG: hypothetical protein JWN46_3495 [Acidimicrobiales bacterium]|nr:hypothetical protein [Acidimicrobiales bacterium]